MKIAVLGAGAMGSIYGAYLSSQHDVLMLDALQSRVADISARGIELALPCGERKRYAVRAALSGEVDGCVDLLLVFVKGMCTYAAIRMNRALLSSETLILSLQNGYGNHLEILRAEPGARLLLGTTMHGGTMLEDGCVLHAASGRTELGAWDERARGAESGIASAFCACGLETWISNDIRSTVWRKLIVNAGINGVAALLETDNRFLAEEPAARDTICSIVREAVRVANAGGCCFDAEEMCAFVVDTARRTGANLASMLQDVLRGRPTEAEQIYGAIAREAKDAGLEAPCCALLRTLIRAREHSRKGSAYAIQAI